MTIRLEFQITFEEFREEVLAVQRVNARKQRAAQMRRRMGASAVALTVVGTVVMLALVVLGSWTDRFTAIRPPHYVLFTLLVPGAVVTTAGFLLARSQQVRLAERPARWVVRILRLPASVMPVAVVAGILLAVWLPRAAAAPGGLYDWYGTLFPHAAWVFAVALTFAASARAARRQIEQLWEQHPSMYRPRVVELGPGGLTVDEAVAAWRYAWPALVRLVETQHLLLACPSEVTFEIIPKRAFASAVDLDAARAMLQAEIRDRDEAPAAFPVLTPALRAPNAAQDA